MPDLDPNAYDVFLLRQKLTLGINRYIFSVPDAQGNEGRTACFRRAETVQVQGRH